MDKIHIERFGSLLRKEAPSSVEEVCPICGRSFKVSIRSMANGDDVCPFCQKQTVVLRRSTVSLVSFYKKSYRSLNAFYGAFWHWASGCSNEEAVAHAAASVLLYLDKVAESQDEIQSVEWVELFALTNLFKAYIKWKTEQTRRAWRRLYYAFWYTESVYLGAE